MTRSAAKTILAGIKEAVAHGGGILRVLPVAKRGETAVEEYVASTARACAACGTSFEEPDPRLFSFNSHRGRCPSCNGYGIAAGRAHRSAKTLADDRGKTLDFADAAGDSIVATCLRKSRAPGRPCA